MPSSDEPPAVKTAGDEGELQEEDSLRLPDGSIYEDPILEPEEEELLVKRQPTEQDRALVQQQLSVSRQFSEAAPGNTESRLSLYGKPVNSEEAASLCPPGKAGLIIHATIMPDSASDGGDASKHKGKYETKFLPDGSIKPRRGPPLAWECDFFSSLVQTPDGRWVFSGVLNGWPGLQILELRSVTARVPGKLSNGFKAKIARSYDAKTAASNAPKPSYPKGEKSVRVTLRLPAWSTEGYTESAAGFVWWYFQTRPQPTLAHGENIVAALAAGPRGKNGGSPRAVRAHLFAHRYAKKKESAKDKMLYHAAILLEWDHGAPQLLPQLAHDLSDALPFAMVPSCIDLRDGPTISSPGEHCTVVELATLHGVGGRLGKSNWCEAGPQPRLVRHITPSTRCIPLQVRGQG